MSRHNKPQWHEPVAAIIIEEDAPLEDTIEVGVVVLADGPLDPVPLSEGPRDQADYAAPRSSVGAMPDFNSPASSQNKGTDVAQNTQDAVQGVADKAKDAASDAAGKAKDAAADTADKVKDAAAQVQDKVKDTAADLTDKAKDAAGKIAASVTDAEAKVKDSTAQTADTAKSLSAKTGNALWSLVQRSPLQTLVFLGSLLWLVRHNSSAASQPPVSINDAAGKVGTAAGQAQAALGTLGSQVKEQAQHGQGWFAKTLQQSPLIIGAMALIAGAALGLSVPETSYEDKMLGGKRDELVGKVQDAAQDLTQKVTVVAQTAAHDAVESVKAEAKNQGLTGDADTDDAKPEDAKPEDAKPEDAKPEDAKPEDAPPAGDQNQSQS